MMSEYDRTCKLLRLRTTFTVDEACRFLEAHGQVFCVDFGTDNAVDKALAIMELGWGLAEF